MGHQDTLIHRVSIQPDLPVLDCGGPKLVNESTVKAYAVWEGMQIPPRWARPIIMLLVYSDAVVMLQIPNYNSLFMCDTD